MERHGNGYGAVAGSRLMAHGRHGSLSDERCEEVNESSVPVRVRGE